MSKEDKVMDNEKLVEILGRLNKEPLYSQNRTTQMNGYTFVELSSDSSETQREYMECLSKIITKDLDLDLWVKEMSAKGVFVTYTSTIYKDKKAKKNEKLLNIEISYNGITRRTGAIFPL